MRKLYAFLPLVMMSLAVSAQDTLYTEDFESAPDGSNYTTSLAQFTDGVGDFFTRTDGTTIGGFYEVTGQQGSFWFAAMDIDDGGVNPTTATMTTASIDITNYGDIMFKLLIAEDDDGTNEDWDDDTQFLVEYSIDGGAFTTAFAVEAKELRPDNSVSSSNKEPAVDADFDGFGDIGSEMSPTFTEYTVAIPGTGTGLQIRLTFGELNASDEDISIDNLRVEANVLSNDGFAIEGLEMYPNPSNQGFVSITSARNLDKTVSIIDMLGKQVAVDRPVRSNRLDVSDLSAGIYILRITEDESTSTRKLIIQ